MKYSLSLDEIADIFIRLVNQYRMMDEFPHYFKNEDTFLHVREIHTIGAVGRNENINITNLAKFQGVTKSAASQMIKKLVKKGLVTKNVSAETENEVVLRLTEKGAVIFEEHQRYHRYLNEKIAAILSKVPPEAVDSFVDLGLDLEKLFKEIAEQRKESFEIKSKSSNLKK